MGIVKSIRIPLAYLAGLTAAELLTTLSNPQIGLILHGILLVLLIIHSTLFSRRGEQKLLITLTLAPLIRLMSLSIPLLNFPVTYWYAVIGAPLLLAAFLVLRLTGFKAKDIGLNMRALPWQLVIGLTGLVFGYVEYRILRPAPLIEVFTWQQIWLPALILLIFTGFLEEYIFRGLTQRGALGIFGRYGILYVSAIFAVLHIGYRSLWDVAFVFMVALFFSLTVTRTRSIFGVTISHGLTNITLYLVLPFLLNPSTNPTATIPRIEVDGNPTQLVWSIPNLNARKFSINLEENGISYMNLQRGKSIVNAEAYLDIHRMPYENWHPGYSDVEKGRFADFGQLKLILLRMQPTLIYSSS